MLKKAFVLKKRSLCARKFTFKVSMFKKIALLSAVCGLSIFAASIGNAATTVPSSIGVSGSYAGSCSISSTSIALGSPNLSALADSTYGATTAFTRIPVSLPVVCNSTTLTWSIYTADGNGSPFTIGSEAGNLVCILRASGIGGSGRSSCSTAANKAITGTGSSTALIELAVWHPGITGDMTNKPFRGTGAISSTIPVTLEF